VTTPSETTIDPVASAKLAKQASAGLWCGILALVFFIFFGAAALVGTLPVKTGPGPQVQPSMAVEIVLLACSGLSVVFSIAAVVLGALGRRSGNVTNRGSAIAGLVMGIVTLSFYLCNLALLLVILGPSLITIYRSGL